MKSILARLRTWFGQQPSPPAATTTNEAAPGKPRKRPPGVADLQLHSRDAQQLLAGRKGGRGASSAFTRLRKKCVNWNG